MSSNEDLLHEIIDDIRLADALRELTTNLGLEPRMKFSKRRGISRDVARHERGESSMSVASGVSPLRKSSVATGNWGSTLHSTRQHF